MGEKRRALITLTGDEGSPVALFRRVGYPTPTDYL